MNIQSHLLSAWRCLLFLLLPYSVSQAQLVDGIIRDEMLNQYRRVTLVGSCWVEVTAVDSLVIPGDRIVIMQMQGATVSLKSDTSFGQVIDAQSAGNFEFATVDRVVNNRIYFTRSISRNYEIDGVVQLIKVRHYRNAAVSGVAFVQPFNGSVGGVAVIEVQDTLLFFSGAGIDVSASGFRGGRAIEYNRGCGGTSGYFYGQPEGDWSGNKGEGIAAIPPTHIGGRGAFANGGGGGNNHNAGGGGGANGGAGGFGGCEWSGCSQRNLQTRGIGGYSVPQQATQPIRVFMGGGGGAGHTNNGTGTSGGDGGGIIIIRAKQVIGGTLTSGGGDVPLTVGQGQDGCGGGGAGGTIVLDVGSIAGTINVNANGGNGGSTTFTEYVGPGGGGSGGVIWCRDATVAASLQTNINSGSNGIHVNNGNNAWEATNGEMGTIASGFTIDEGKPSFETIIDGERPISLCSGGSVVITGLSGFSDYQWSTGQTSTAITVATSGVYYLSAINAEGCRSHDSIEVIYNTALVANAGADITLCQGGSIGLMASAQHGVPPFNYEWSPSASLSSTTTQNPIASPTTQTRYQVIITDANGCRDTAWVTVTPVPSPLQIVYSSANGAWDWDTIELNAIRCDSIILRNTSSDTLTITASLLANLEFSMPPTQFPLRIPPGSQRSLKVCLRSGILGEQQDTLIYSALCSGQIPLLARIQFDASGTDICGDSLRLRPSTANAGLLRILPPKPNPVLHETIITVERAAVDGNIVNPGLCVLYNAAGIAVLQTEPAEVNGWEANSTVLRQFHYRLVLDQLPAGLYQVTFPSVGKSSLPMVVVR